MNILTLPQQELLHLNDMCFLSQIAYIGSILTRVCTVDIDTNVL